MLNTLFAACMTSLEGIQLTSLLSEVFKKAVSPTAMLKHSTLRETLSSFSAASAPSVTLSQSTSAFTSSGQELQDQSSRGMETMLGRLDFDTRMLGILTARANNVTTPRDFERILEYAIPKFSIHISRATLFVRTSIYM